MLTRDLLSALEVLSERKNIREYASYYAASAFFRTEKYEEVERVILSHLEGRKNSELISCTLSSGIISDSGNVQFHILKGRVFEFYDYKEMSACFIRLYHLQDLSNGKEWVALYIDENPSTPWWAEERL
ncbi:hypothetical protein [Candidatus Pyrohabitans sp.]